MRALPLCWNVLTSLSKRGLPQELRIRPLDLKYRVHPIYSIRLFLDDRLETEIPPSKEGTIVHVRIPPRPILSAVSYD
jgi:hypothetical protein